MLCYKNFYITTIEGFSIQVYFTGQFIPWNVLKLQKEF